MWKTMNPKAKIMILLVVTLAVIASVIWYFADSSEKRSEKRSDLKSTERSDLFSDLNTKTIPQSEQRTLELPQTFRHSAYRFSFKYPEGFRANILPDAESGGETILVQDVSKNAGFQIHLEPYDDPDTDITAERLARDIPEMIVKEPQEVQIGASGQAGKGLAFIATDTGTREVWFIFGGTLFQLTAPIENDALLQRVLGTWTFK